jgi:2-polyprenyl-6-methoxyphenol hydroxylase-like FAD-dependent oxidoreductase
MSRKVAIIGAGQSGLQLGFGLLANGYEVTIVTDRSAEQILAGKILSSQGMFGEALEIERQLNIDYWQNIAPQKLLLSVSLKLSN